MRGGEEVRLPITLEVLCANLAQFLGVDDPTSLHEIVRRELSRKELIRTMKSRLPSTMIVEGDATPIRQIGRRKVSVNDRGEGSHG